MTTVSPSQGDHLMMRKLMRQSQSGLHHSDGNDTTTSPQQHHLRRPSPSGSIIVRRSTPVMLDAQSDKSVNSIGANSLMRRNVNESAAVGRSAPPVAADDDPVALRAALRAARAQIRDQCDEIETLRAEVRLLRSRRDVPSHSDKENFLGAMLHAYKEEGLRRHCSMMSAPPHR